MISAQDCNDLVTDATAQIGTSGDEVADGIALWQGTHSGDVQSVGQTTSGDNVDWTFPRAHLNPCTDG